MQAEKNTALTHITPKSGPFSSHSVSETTTIEASVYDRGTKISRSVANAGSVLCRHAELQK